MRKLVFQKKKEKRNKIIIIIQIFLSKPKSFSNSHFSYFFRFPTLHPHFLVGIFSFSHSHLIISTSTQTIRLRETNESHVYIAIIAEKPGCYSPREQRGERMLDHWTFYYLFLAWIFASNPFPRSMTILSPWLNTSINYNLSYEFNASVGLQVVSRKL